MSSPSAPRLQRPACELFELRSEGRDLRAGRRRRRGFAERLHLSTLNAGTTVPGADAFGGYTGTSMATPHVSGVDRADAERGAGAADARAGHGLLMSTARPFPVKPDKAIGVGIIDATAAVQRGADVRPAVTGRPLTSGVAESVPPLAAGQA
jgi:serine protease